MIKETLDEAIEALVFCLKGLCEYCPFNKEDRNFCEDAKCAVALGYLKEYKKKCEDLVNATKDLKKEKDLYSYALNDVASTQIPLTWEELKTMESEPVWIELLYHHPEQKYEYLDIIKYFDMIADYEVIVLSKTGYLYKDLLGKDWKAYQRGEK